MKSKVKTAIDLHRENPIKPHPMHQFTEAEKAEMNKLHYAEVEHVPMPLPKDSFIHEQAKASLEAEVQSKQ